MRRYVARHRPVLESGIMALVLPFVAGAVNASGFFIVGVYTSHMTGNFARIGDELAQGHLSLAWAAALLVIAFFSGATFATYLVERPRSGERSRYAGALWCEILTLSLVAVLGISAPKSMRYVQQLSALLLCFSMGAQNALISRLSGAVVRTTHLTGVITDLGIETVRVSAWLRASTEGQSLWRRPGKIWRARRDAELARLRLHCAILGSFLTGAIVGPWLYLHWGYLSMLFPITVLLGLLTFEYLFGLRFDPRPSPQS